MGRPEGLCGAPAGGTRPAAVAAGEAGRRGGGNRVRLGRPEYPAGTVSGPYNPAKILSGPQNPAGAESGPNNRVIILRMAEVVSGGNCPHRRARCRGGVKSPLPRADRLDTAMVPEDRSALGALGPGLAPRPRTGFTAKTRAAAGWSDLCDALCVTACAHMGGALEASTPLGVRSTK